VDRLAPALLAKAFRGELVPQDPGDEPAAALLERIRAARATAEPETSRKPRRPRSAKPARPEPPPAEAPLPACQDVAPDHLSALLREHGPLSLSDLWMASRLPINHFEAQLQDEAARGLLREIHQEEPDGERQLEAA
jgi:hypothetical protein